MTAGRINTSQNHHWCTPPKYVIPIMEFFDNALSLDPCSNEHSLIEATITYSLPYQDGLLSTWNFPTIYINPPYGKDKIRKSSIKDWLYKCAEAHQQYNSEILALIPVATNTKHWKQYVFPVASNICFLADTRLKFYINGQEEPKGAPMACSMIYWGINGGKYKEIFKEYGAVVSLRT